jgi:dTDP-4-dehydrorhamnose reductase
VRLLLIGANGMLASDVARAGARAGHELVGVDLPEIDITDVGACKGLFMRVLGEPGGLDGAINCAAWTDVDGAQDRPEEAKAVNAGGAGNLGRAAADIGVPLVHVSTDYVFDGVAPLDASGRPRPYVESDPTGPRSVYGQTKLEGERLVLAASPKHTVVRTAWLYGVDGKNFVATMLGLAGGTAADQARGAVFPNGREAVQVVTDQIGSPTWSGHLAPALLGLLERGVAGLAHMTGAGQVSWNGFAAEIFRQADLACRVEPATSDQMARPAPRPAWSALESERADVLPMPPWQDGLAGYLAARDGMISP